VNPPLRRGEFVTVRWGDGQAASAMVTLASSNGRSIMVMGEFILAGFVGACPLSEVGDGALTLTGQFETLTGVPVTVERGP
jgi:hypothetical protein